MMSNTAEGSGAETELSEGDGQGQDSGFWEALDDTKNGGG